VDARAFASKWFLTLFSCRCSLLTTVRIFEWFLFDGWDAVYLTALVFVHKAASKPVSHPIHIYRYNHYH
jgi:hypothetical protein